MFKIPLYDYQAVPVHYPYQVFPEFLTKWHSCLTLNSSGSTQDIDISASLAQFRASIVKISASTPDIRASTENFSASIVKISASTVSFGASTISFSASTSNSAPSTISFSGGTALPDSNLANFSSIDRKTTKVGSYPVGASPYGLLDMAGNVEEMCDDRIARGGSFYSNEKYIQCTSQNKYDSSSRNNALGFRLCMAAKH